jgi:hypothetical protein
MVSQGIKIIELFLSLVTPVLKNIFWVMISRLTPGLFLRGQPVPDLFYPKKNSTAWVPVEFDCSSTH